MSKYDTLNPMQREAVFHTEGPLLVLAGAGSGKTRVLTHRIAYLIEEKRVAPWNIMAITFTNKAAAEMRERVDKIVGEGAEAIWVSTFHSSCVRILRRFIDRLGYDTNFTIYDGDDQKTLMKQVLKKMQADPKQLRSGRCCHGFLRRKMTGSRRMSLSSRRERTSGRKRLLRFTGNTRKNSRRIMPWISTICW